MPDFTQKLQTAEGSFDVSFKEITHPPERAEFLVTVVEDDYAALPFCMKLTEGGWKIPTTTQVAFWLRRLESHLQKAIGENAAP